MDPKLQRFARSEMQHQSSLLCHPIIARRAIVFVRLSLHTGKECVNRVRLSVCLSGVHFCSKAVLLYLFGACINGKFQELCWSFS